VHGERSGMPSRERTIVATSRAGSRVLFPALCATRAVARTTAFGASTRLYRAEGGGRGHVKRTCVYPFDNSVARFLLRYLLIPALSSPLFLSHFVLSVNRDLSYRSMRQISIGSCACRGVSFDGNEDVQADDAGSICVSISRNDATAINAVTFFT